MNGMLEELENLKENFDGKFLITKEVKYEIIDRPVKTKRFELEALNLKKFLEDKILEMPESFGVRSEDVSVQTQKHMETANQMFEAKGSKIKIIDLGETSCLALSRILTQKGIDNVIAADERTIRVLSEKPENLKNLLQKKLKTKVYANPKHHKEFADFKFIRSTELVYVIYKKGLTNLKGPNVLDAMLYAMKFKGCAISENEIKEIKKLG